MLEEEGVRLVMWAGGLVVRGLEAEEAGLKPTAEAEEEGLKPTVEAVDLELEAGCLEEGWEVEAQGSPPEEARLLVVPVAVGLEECLKVEGVTERKAEGSGAVVDHGQTNQGADLAAGLWGEWEVAALWLIQRRRKGVGREITRRLEAAGCMPYQSDLVEKVGWTDCYREGLSDMEKGVPVCLCFPEMLLWRQLGMTGLQALMAGRGLSQRAGQVIGEQWAHQPAHDGRLRLRKATALPRSPAALWLQLRLWYTMPCLEWCMSHLCKSLSECTGLALASTTIISNDWRCQWGPEWDHKTESCKRMGTLSKQEPSCADKAERAQGANGASPC